MPDEDWMRRIAESAEQFRRDTEDMLGQPFEELRKQFGPHFYDPDGAELTFVEWTELFAARLDRDDSWWRRQTMVGDLEVSTVWLGLDHSFLPDSVPLTWETMIFKVNGDERVVHDGPDFQARYSTREQAWAGHEATVRELREGKLPE